MIALPSMYMEVGILGGSLHLTCIMKLGFTLGVRGALSPHFPFRTLGNSHVPSCITSAWFCCCFIAHLCSTLCNPMDCSTPGFPILHYLLELLKFMSLESVILTISSLASVFSSCLQPFPASRSFPMSWLCIRWPKYWRFSISISLSNEYSGLIFFKIDWFDLLAVQGTP